MKINGLLIANPLEYVKISTFFEDIARYRKLSGGGASAVISGSRGIYFQTSATAGSYVSIDEGGSLPNVNYFTSPTSLTIGMYLVTRGTDYEWFGVVGYISNSAAGANFANGHYGFRIVRGGNGAEVVYATNSNNTNQTQTDITATISFQPTYGNVFTAIYENSCIKFYVNGVLGATHTTNLPNAGNSSYMFDTGCSNLNVATDSRIGISFLEYAQKRI